MQSKRTTRPSLTLACAHCGQSFQTWPAWLRKGARFCSRRCTHLAHQQPAEAILARVDRSDVDGCWPYTGTTDSYGYGVAKLNGRAVKVHRLVYTLAFGEPPADRPFVCHRCNNRPCCREDHLYADDTNGNMRHMVGSGRSRKGEGNPRRKLTDEAVQEIRALASAGKVNWTRLGRRFGCSATAVKLAAFGATWRHLE